MAHTFDWLSKLTAKDLLQDLEKKKEEIIFVRSDATAYRALSVSILIERPFTLLDFGFPSNSLGSSERFQVWRLAWLSGCVGFGFSVGSNIQRRGRRCLQ